MMKFKRSFPSGKQRGFSLLELLLVIAILSLIVGAVFSQMGDAQRRLNAEEMKLGDFQEARDFVDQFFRDINQAGTPNIRMFDPTVITFGPPPVNDSRLAVGLVSIADNAQNTPNWGTEINDVITSPIFKYYQYDGTQIPSSSLPADISTSAGQQLIANVKTIQIN